MHLGNRFQTNKASESSKRGCNYLQLCGSTDSMQSSIYGRDGIPFDAREVGISKTEWLEPCGWEPQNTMTYW